MSESTEMRMGKPENHDNERKPGRWGRFKAVVASLALAGTLSAGACSNEASEGIPPIPTTDGGCETGTCGDGGSGGSDGGSGGMDAGPTTDGGTTTDGGSGGSDAGPVACATATTGSWEGLIPNGGSHTVGGYVFAYNGPSGADALVSVTCDGSATGSYSLPEDVVTVINLPTDGKSLKLTPHSLNVTQTHISIQVVNYP